MLSDFGGVGAMAPAALAYRRGAGPAYRPGKDAGTGKAERVIPPARAEAEEKDGEAAPRADPAAGKAETPERGDRFEQSDKAIPSFSSTRKERRAPTGASDEGVNPDSPSGPEREPPREAAERLGEYFDENLARRNNSRERVEKALGEWFSRPTRGDERQGPLELLRLLRRAALGAPDGADAEAAGGAPAPRAEADV